MNVYWADVNVLQISANNERNSGEVKNVMARSDDNNQTRLSDTTVCEKCVNVSFSVFEFAGSIRIAFHHLPVQPFTHEVSSPLSAPFLTEAELISTLEQVGLPLEIAAANQHYPRKIYAVTLEQLLRLGFLFPEIEFVGR